MLNLRSRGIAVEVGPRNLLPFFAIKIVAEAIVDSPDDLSALDFLLLLSIFPLALTGI